MGGGISLVRKYTNRKPGRYEMFAIKQLIKYSRDITAVYTYIIGYKKKKSLKLLCT